jgi:PIN domain
MNQKLKKTILFVDFENIQNLDLSIVQKQDIDIKIFLGQSQNKITLELVRNTQHFGERVEWIKIEGTGSNSLDFYIAFYLGKFFKDFGNCSFVILSKDKGFDPLVEYICKQNVNCQRIQSLLELSQDKDLPITENKDLFKIIMDKLCKINKNQRPKAKNTFRRYIQSVLIKEKLSDEDIDKLMNEFFVQNKVSEDKNHHITYNF